MSSAGSMGALEQLAKSIEDVDRLSALLIRQIPLKAAWQQRLHAELLELDRSCQVLRMTIAMNKPLDEILAAASSLNIQARSVVFAVAGTRVDTSTNAAVRLIGGLCAAICRGMGTHGVG